MVNKEVHPLLNYIVSPAGNKSSKISQRLPDQRPHARHNDDADAGDHAIHDDEFRLALTTLEKAVDVNRFMIIRVEINPQAKVII